MKITFLLAAITSTLLFYFRASNEHATIERCVSHIEAPHYVPLARQAAIQSDVNINVHVDEAGTVTEVQVISGHPLLAEEAVRNIKLWQFKPGTASNLNLTYQFKLEEPTPGAKPTSTVTFDLPNRVRLTESRPIPQP
jgi:TonB family protein